MKLLTVIVHEYSEYVTYRLNKEINNFRKEEIVIEKNINTLGKTINIEFNVMESTLGNYTIDDFKKTFKHYMANACSDIIIHDLEEKLVNKILINQYYYFSPGERQSILKHLKNILENEAYRYGEEVTKKISRKGKILQEMMDYFTDNHVMNLEGFVRFRLKNYLQELEDNIDKAVEDFLMEKEYNEFIRLLRYFVDIQEAKIDTINVLMDEDGKYHLYDKLNRTINNEYLEDLALEMADKDISYDDLLISSLITLAPKKINIHFTGKSKKKEIIETIKNVFSDRVYVCRGCEFCLPAKHVKQE